MPMIWMYKHAPPTLKSMRLCFPLCGHSDLLADRVFGRLEKILRAHSILEFPEKYWDIYSQFGDVRKLGQDLNKVSAISDAKRLLFKRTAAGGVCPTLLKKGKKLEMIILPKVPLNRQIKDRSERQGKCFVDNMPDNCWYYRVMEKHDEQLTTRLLENIKRSRAEVSIAVRTKLILAMILLPGSSPSFDCEECSESGTSLDDISEEHFTSDIDGPLAKIAEVEKKIRKGHFYLVSFPGNKGPIIMFSLF
ncbi:btb domain transcription factor [Holotrichia oblita]|uniref:Btb domain transcription factor n=1 Tax=Holotrichia oblita TaxID=644536 RepID=A0ACB9THG4_HOLOL|nr:btb domain transcription factor [Holotrichia oblita]